MTNSSPLASLILLGLVFSYLPPVYAEENSSPITVRNASSDTKPFREPVFDEAGTGIESQYQRQILQREVQELRGLVEELAHEVQQLKQTQADRYLELDRRFEDFRKRTFENIFVIDI